ncbi:MAG: hypothetical protein AB7O96_03200 [Pseudobdellovibrionaceae bacterium]
MQEHLKGFAIFSSAVAIGVGMMLSTWKGGKEFASISTKEKFYSPETTRDPAAIQKTFDFSELDGDALSLASKRRLLSGARVIREGKNLGFELGHFVVKGVEGEKAFACDKFDQVTVVFEAEGMAYNGEMPEMEVTGGCQVSADINRISPLWVPYNEILAETPKEGEFTFQSHSDIKIRFSKVLDAWPKKWNLKSIRMASTGKPDSAVWLTREELIKYSREPIFMEWTQQ